MRILRLRTILAATDLSESSDAALASGARLAAAAGATLHVVLVSAPSEPAEGGKSRSLAAGLRRAVERAGAAASESRMHVIPGDPKTTIGPLAEALHADVIVLGRHHQGEPSQQRAVGGTAHAVIIDAGVPCLVVSRPFTLPVRRALVAVDESETSRGALIVAISWASALRDRSGPAADLTAVHVDIGRETPLIHRIIDEELAALRRVGGEWAGVSVSAVTLDAPNPVAAIAGYANEMAPDLVVLGTRALGRPTHPVFGSVAAAVTSRLAIPVLLVPPAVWRDYAGDIEISGRVQGITDAKSALR